KGVQYSMLTSYKKIETAALIRDKAAILFDNGDTSGNEANMCKYLSSEATWEAANNTMDLHGGYGLAKEYHIERKFREARLYKVAPITNNLIVTHIGQHVLGLPRSF